MSEPAYFVATYDVTNPEAYQAYVQGVVPLLQKHNAEILCADYEAETIEGATRGVTIVLRFPSMQAAKAWYEDPEYKPVLLIRLDNTTIGAASFAKQFVMPGS